ncbi:aspartyl-tRNA synthetase [Bacillus sp. SCS-153A]|uniref:aspartyl-tRNA synthetase n=1 Tax=Rossellomorea sedimentorum TaxID=3115294 RepID=UPI0039057E71
MNNSIIIKYVILFILVIAILGMWSIGEQQDSHMEPHQAIQATEEGLTLIPAYKGEDQSLYFFIKDRNNLGAVYVNKGIFGWKSGMLTWGPKGSMNNFDKLGGFQMHGENLVYGLIRLGQEQSVRVDEHEADLLNLAMLPSSVVQEHHLEGLFLWYFEMDDQSEYEQVKLLHKDTQEIIQLIEL